MKKNELIAINKDLIIKNPNKIDDLLKPLSRDILLFTTKIGMTYKVKDKLPILKLSIGDRLSFKHNKALYDENEITIHNENGELVGYIPEADSPVFAKLMDAGKMLFAIVKNKSNDSGVPLIDIDIYLKDF